MHRNSINELVKLLFTKKISSSELVSHYLARIKKYDSTINSFITVNDQALKQAREIDQKQDPTKPLAGIPIAIKDIFCTQGIKTTCASKMLSNFIAPYNATVIEKLITAGAIILGKTNMDEFAMGSSNENSYYGPVKNPWNLEKVPGGSSGGSAAAVAANLAPIALGTDTGGSIRQPAAFCGLTGIKPTYGRVSRFGMVAFASSLDQCGIFAHSAEDAALLMQVIAGFDPKDSTSVNTDVPNYTAELNHPLKGLRIGLPKEYFTADLETGIAVAIDEAIGVLEKLGASIQEISLPHNDLALAVYYVIAPAECSSNLARYDGVRYGMRCENPKNLEDLYTRTRSECFSDEVKRRIMVGTYVLSSGYYDAYYLQAQKARTLIARDFQQAFNNIDIILAPSAPTTAFKLNEKTDNPINMYLSDIYTIPVNLAGLPAISLPAGFADELPVGIQLIGNHFAESKILNVAHQYQKQTDWHLKMPESFE